MSSAATIATKRAHRAAAGMCTECDQPRFQAHSLCQRHFALQTGRMARYTTNLADRKLCYCGDRRLYRRTRCAACLELESAKMKARAQELKAANLCRQCGKGQVRPPFTACRGCRRQNAQGYSDSRIGTIRKRLRLLIKAEKLPMPVHLKQKARFLLGAMQQVEATRTDHWRPTEAACRDYARANPEFEGFLLVTRKVAPNRQGGIERTWHAVYLVTRARGARRERIEIRHIPTYAPTPQEIYV